MSTVVFIGGGPSAWWTAIQAKILNPDLDIQVLEKHDEYQRKHTLNLDPGSFVDIPFHPRLQEIVDGFKAKRIVPTVEIEEKLSRLGQELGIRMRYTEVTDPESLMFEYYDADLFVGADGSHSIVRKAIFENEMENDQDMQYIAEVKYFVEEREVPLKNRIQVSSKLASSAMSEQVGRPDQHRKVPVSLRIFIDREMYEAMKQATFKNPYGLDSEMDPVLQQRIRNWLEAKRHLFGENRIEGSEKITVTKLSVYESKSMVKELKGRIWALVGDAAFGVPFFRSMNNALLCGTKLAQCIAAGTVFEYENFAKKLAYYEIFKARIKNLFLNIWYYFVHCTGISEINDWSLAAAASQQFKGGRVFRRALPV